MTQDRPVADYEHPGPWAWVGVGPEPVGDRDRWITALPIIQAALMEVGYPSRFDLVGPKWDTEHSLTFDVFPPSEMLMQAARIAGIEDLMADLVGAPSGRTEER